MTATRAVAWTWTCPDCGTAYRIRLFTCPRCHHQEAAMPKIVREVGPSDEVLNPPTPEDPRTEVSPAEAEARQLLESEVVKRALRPKARDKHEADVARDVPADEAEAHTEADETPEPKDNTEAEGASSAEECEDETTGQEQPEVAGDDNEPATVRGAATPPRPAPTATRREWVEYAESVTGDRVPTHVTRAELIERHGGN